MQIGVDHKLVRSRSWLGCDLDGVTLNTGEHRPKDDTVKRHHGVPMEQSGQAARFEESGLVERARRITIRSYAKVESAWPGSFISARKDSARSRSMPTTRQKWSPSPWRERSGC